MTSSPHVRSYYYARDPLSGKNFGGPWVTMIEVARAVVRFESKGRPYELRVIQGGMWRDLSPAERESLVAHTDELRPKSDDLRRELRKSKRAAKPTRRRRS